MLQFLQYKTFGNHRVPDGFVIVTAGNPPEYNKSVRDFDIVTYDRVKRIMVEEDYRAWKEYAGRAQIHGAILSYLEIKKKNFYSVVSDMDGKRFVTARGWEDLSQVMKVYEKLGLPVTFDFVVQYLQDEEIARDFAAYYELYNKYRNVYRIEDILAGEVPESAAALKDAPFDEKLSLLGLLIERLGQEFLAYVRQREEQQALLAQLQYLRQDMKEKKEPAREILSRQIESCSTKIAHGKKAGLLDREAERTARGVQQAMEACLQKLAAEGTGEAKNDFGLVKAIFDAREASRRQQIEAAGEHLTNAFSFLARVFGEGQEMVIFLTELSAGYYSLQFVRDCGNEAYYKYNRLLLLKDRREELTAEARRLCNSSVYFEIGNDMETMDK
jgi:hypothetical protein